MSAETSAYNHVQEFRWWRGNPDEPDSVNQLRDLAALRDAVNDAIRDAARNGVHDDLTWAQVGDALGVSRQAAQKRFGDSGEK